jgi:hypothetical protein
MLLLQKIGAKQRQHSKFVSASTLTGLVTQLLRATVVVKIVETSYKHCLMYFLKRGGAHEVQS